ncbi:flagellar basal body P-ring protein FlgI [Isosphaeraceae bacterium EP7]
MRRMDAGARRMAARSLAGLLVALVLAGAGPAKTDKDKKKKKDDTPTLRVDEAVGNLAQIRGSELRLEGVGLVVDLDNTGADPPPGVLRARLLDQMKKAGVSDSDKILASKRTALVLVRLIVPPGASPKDRIDAEIEIPSNTATTSLAGGRLLTANLAQVMIAGGDAKEGFTLGKAGGPVMTGSKEKPDDVKSGRILGGGRCLKEVPYIMILDERRKSIKTSALIQAVINARFFQHEGTDQKGLANAQNDQQISLKVPLIYHQNQARYFRVVKLLPLVDTAELRAKRLGTLSKELLDPKTAGIAALKLEAMGPPGIDTLKVGLTSPNAQVRFFAAEALAYLRDPSGVDVLAETAVKRSEFRSQALGALAAMDDSASYIRLRSLMNEADVAVRYGAFDAIRTASPFDESLGRVRILHDQPAPSDDDSMAHAISGVNPKRPRDNRPPRADDPFALYMVDSEGPPLVHISSTKHAEIVIFGQGQKMLTPIVLGGGGAILLNAADGDTSVQISRIVPSRAGAPDVKMNCSLAIGEIIRETANLGATYPELVEILQSASRQKNLSGPLIVDAAPAGDLAYEAAALNGIDPTLKVDDSLKKTKAEPEARPRFLSRLFGRKAKDVAEADSKAKDSPKSDAKTSDGKKPDDGVKDAQKDDKAAPGPLEAIDDADLPPLPEESKP